MRKEKEGFFIVRHQKDLSQGFAPSRLNKLPKKHNTLNYAKTGAEPWCEYVQFHRYNI